MSAALLSLDPSAADGLRERTMPAREAMAKAPIVIAAGGTGGHFFPAEALAAALLARGRAVVLMTDARSAGLTSGVFAAGERHVLRGAGVAGRGLLRAAKGLFALAAGAGEARRLLAVRPVAAVVGFGGYPAVAPVLAARLQRRRPAIVLHEQNAVLGRANRLLARFADALALSFAETRRVPTVATQVTGNPVRPAIVPMPYVAPGECIELVVLGGSLGARVLSEVVPGAVAALPEALRRRIAVTQQCRREDLPAVRAAYQAIGVAARLETFFADVGPLLAAAHLVIARAGASTVAELAVAGRPAILVPLPGAIDDHQAANARGLGGATVIRQAEFTPAALAAALTALLADPAALAVRAAEAAASGRADAAERLADLVESLAP